MNGIIAPQDLDIGLNRDLFLRMLIRELAGTLESIIGYEEAAGYISLVGQSVGNWINGLYREALGVERLSLEQVSEVLVDLKRRIQGCFAMVESGPDRIVLKNSGCPFEDKVLDRPSMCMMTSNVFGVITASNLGYARVVLNETIAQGASGCTVTVYLRQDDDLDAVEGREYYGD